MGTLTMFGDQKTKLEENATTGEALKNLLNLCAPKQKKKSQTKKVVKTDTNTAPLHPTPLKKQIVRKDKNTKIKRRHKAMGDGKGNQVEHLTEDGGKLA